MADLDELIYPIAQWSVTEDQLDLSKVPGDETVFALANGYMGIRGTFEEQSVAYAPGSFINGFYETEPIVYGESAYGFAANRQRRLLSARPSWSATSKAMCISSIMLSRHSARSDFFSTKRNPTLASIFFI